MKICIVTAELSSFGVSGGIGAAYEELALLLARNGHEVDIMYCGAVQSPEAEERFRERLASYGIGLATIRTKQYAAGPAWDPVVRSYSVARALVESGEDYDVIHFHEFGGVGFHATNMKRQGLAFTGTTFVVGLHGSREWVSEQNDHLKRGHRELKLIHLERASIRNSDFAVSPSQYLLDWMREKNYHLPAGRQSLVIHNVCTNLIAQMEDSQRAKVALDEVIHPNEIIMFGRHEERKGFIQFIKALSMLEESLWSRDIKITFLGGFTQLAGAHSGLLLAEMGRRWRFRTEIIPDADRQTATQILNERRNAVVVVPSGAENSPYTVLELLALRLPFLCSSAGGAKELIDPQFHATALSETSAAGLSAALTRVLDEGIRPAHLATTTEQTERDWLEFHNEISTMRLDDSLGSEDAVRSPRVVLGITHHERPDKVIDAIMSGVRQDYQNLEIVVVDDGSVRPTTVSCLSEIERLLAHYNGRLIRRENGYLGAARNTVAANSESEYIVFLDDDDYACPSMVSTAVAAAQRTGAAVTGFLNVYFNASQRGRAFFDEEVWQKPVEYLPIGGPLSLAPVENIFSGATALIRREAFNQIGGYSELHGVGFEDWELFARFAQAGHEVDVIAEPMYLYETGASSMIGAATGHAAYRRVLDAIDFSANGDAWRDLIELQASELATSREAARQSAESHATRGLVQASLLKAHGDLELQARILGSYARSLSATAVGDAFDRLANRLSETDGVSRPVRSAKVALRKADSASASLWNVIRGDINAWRRLANYPRWKTRQVNQEIAKRMRSSSAASSDDRPGSGSVDGNGSAASARTRGAGSEMTGSVLVSGSAEHVRLLVDLYTGGHVAVADRIASILAQGSADEVVAEELAWRYVAHFRDDPAALSILRSRVMRWGASDRESGSTADWRAALEAGLPASTAGSRQ